VSNTSKLPVTGVASSGTV